MENYVGKRLDGRYEIMEIIGVGGMAVVYKAFDNIEHKTVAVKILKDEFLANEEFKRRFKNESKAIAVLSHPNIVKVYDVSYGEILQYIVMEYVEGITLKEYIEQQGTVDPREAIYFVTQILRALQHAHDKGIVHRDVKPQNIMLISDGTIKVTDFGIARFSRSETRTMTDGAIGSVHYISPEQAKGNVTDAKTDLYSVGVMLYEMLTGRLPFQSDNAVSVALMQLQNEPELPRQINPDIPQGLEQIIMKAMQKNVNDRYQSASEILVDIEAYKKNPNIKFDYLYQVDPRSVKYVGNKPAEEQVSKVPISQPQAAKSVRKVKEPEMVNPVDDYDYEDDFITDDKSKKKTIAVLCGVLGALVIFAAVLAVMFLPNSGKVDVPDVVGLNFYTEVMNQPEYIGFTFNPVEDPDSEEEAGTIIDQNPGSGKKIRKDTPITIYISGARTQSEVPDVSGLEFAAAQKKLVSEGFEVTIVKEKSDTVEIGKVIRTAPRSGEMVETGSVVTLYVATNEDVEPIDVPNLIGMTLSQAQTALEEVGLVLDTVRTEYRNSSDPVGTIIGHEGIGEQVLPGTSIAVYVSSGKVEVTKDDVEQEDTSDDETTTKESTSAEDTTKPDATSTTKPSTTKPSTTKPTKPSTTKDDTPIVVVPTAEKTTRPTRPTKPSTTKPTQPSTRETTLPPTNPPTQAPTNPPTQAPTNPPTEAPTQAPTNPPTEAPTQAPVVDTE